MVSAVGAPAATASSAAGSSTPAGSPAVDDQPHVEGWVVDVIGGSDGGREQLGGGALLGAQQHDGGGADDQQYHHGDERCGLQPESTRSAPDQDVLRLRPTGNAAARRLRGHGGQRPMR